MRQNRPEETGAACLKELGPYVIPFYIPNEGCPHRCIFCDAKISSGDGEFAKISEDYFNERIKAFLETRKGRGTHVEVAFFGGSFNALPNEKRKYYLSLVAPLLDSKVIDSLRLSLRPDNLDSDFLRDINLAKVKTVELGVQSMNDKTLELIERGHNSSDVSKAINLFKKNNIMVSAHIMVGLPGEDENIFLDSFRNLLDLRPEFVRIHPTLILKGTKLEALFNDSKYSPLNLNDAVNLCSKAVKMAQECNVKVLRLGLQTNAMLDQKQNIAGGPYHPAFGELVISNLIFEKLVDLVERGNLKNSKVFKLRINPKMASKVSGQKGENLERLKKVFNLEEIILVNDSEIPLDQIEIT